MSAPTNDQLREAGYKIVTLTHPLIATLTPPKKGWGDERSLVCVYPLDPTRKALEPAYCVTTTGLEANALALCRAHARRREIGR